MKTKNSPQKMDRMWESLTDTPMMIIRPAMAGGCLAFGFGLVIGWDITAGQAIGIGVLFVGLSFSYAHYNEHIRGKPKSGKLGLPSMNGWQQKKGFFANLISIPENVILINGTRHLRDDYEARTKIVPWITELFGVGIGGQPVPPLQSQPTPHRPQTSPPRINGNISHSTTNKILFVTDDMQIPDTVVLKMLRESWQRESAIGKYTGLSHRSWVKAPSQFVWWPGHLRQSWYDAILILLASASKLLRLQLVFERKIWSAKKGDYIVNGRKLIVQPLTAYYAIFYSQALEGIVRGDIDFMAKKLINQGATLPR